MSLFDNSTNVMINDKEVQSIKITSNNTVLYEKNDGVLKKLSLTSTSNIISVYDGDNIIIIADYTENGVPVQKSCELYQNGTFKGLLQFRGGRYMVPYSNESYDGEGVDIFTAKVDDLESEPLTIERLWYYNKGDKPTDFDTTNTWQSKNEASGTYTVTTDGEWITISRTVGGNYGRIPLTPLTNKTQPFKISLIVDKLDAGEEYKASYSGLYAVDQNNYGVLFQWHPFRMCRSDKGSSDNWKVLYNGGSVSDGTYKYEVIFNDSTVTHNLYDLNDNLLRTHTHSISWNLTSAEYGIHLDSNRKFRIKEIKVSSL